MTSPDQKNGPLTIDDLLATWRAAADEGYTAPIEAAGEGGGLEVYTQLMAQLARASRAVDATTQALYVKPWSGQTAPAAQGEAPARVALTLARAAYLDRPVRLAAGAVAAVEVVTLPGDPSGVQVRTGRRYVLLEDAVFLPGESGPVAVAAEADVPGWGHNNPLPRTISALDQPGRGFYNDRASVVLSSPPTLGQPPPNATATLVTANVADTIIPGHVGQYVAFTAGANAGAVARLSSFVPPSPSADVGSSATLEPMAAVESLAVSGDFSPGELVEVRSGPTTLGWARLVAQHPGDAPRTRLGLAMASGTIAAGDALRGVASGATTTVDQLTGSPVLAAESGTASWRVLDWAADLGVSVTNGESPAGGRLGYLDAIGAERNIPRGASEGDDSYRSRVAEVADVVTPNAVRRALTRVLGAIPYCFREVGTPLLPGFSLDRPRGDAGGDAYDTDALVFQLSIGGTNLQTTIAAADGPRLTLTLGNASLLAGARFIQLGSVAGAEVMHVLSTAGDVVTVQRAVMGTRPAAHAINDQVIPAYLEGERVAFVDLHGNAKASGWFGGVDWGTFDLKLVRLQGPDPVLAAGDQVVGLASGARFDVAAVVPTVADAFRFHPLLDYADFRAFFLVGLPRVGFDEFGFSWGAGAGAPGNDPNGFYDVGPGPNFLDGFPAGAPAFYQRVWGALNGAKAGGVGFGLYLAAESCG